MKDDKDDDIGQQIASAFAEHHRPARSRGGRRWLFLLGSFGLYWSMQEASDALEPSTIATAIDVASVPVCAFGALLLLGWDP